MAKQDLAIFSNLTLFLTMILDQHVDLIDMLSMTWQRKQLNSNQRKDLILYYLMT